MQRAVYGMLGNLSPKNPNRCLVGGEKAVIYSSYALELEGKKDWEASSSLKSDGCSFRNAGLSRLQRASVGSSGLKWAQWSQRAPII